MYSKLRDPRNSFLPSRFIMPLQIAERGVCHCRLLNNPTFTLSWNFISLRYVGSNKVTIFGIQLLTAGVVVKIMKLAFYVCEDRLK